MGAGSKTTAGTLNHAAQAGKACKKAGSSSRVREEHIHFLCVRAAHAMFFFFSFFSFLFLFLLFLHCNT